MVRLQTEALDISYGDRDIVKGLDLEIPEGQITTIIYPNGCGKSTILKTMARIHSAKKGQSILMGLRFIKNQRRPLQKDGYSASNT